MVRYSSLQVFTLLTLLSASTAAQVTIATPSSQFKRPPARPGFSYGLATAVSGDTIAIGHPGDSTIVTDGGSVDVFTWDGAAWNSEGTLRGAAPAIRDNFGAALSMDGDTLIIGAPGSTSLKRGQVFVFERNGSIWSETQVLTNSTTGQITAFGASVALLGDTALVSASLEDDINGIDVGAVYVLQRTGSTWSEVARLSPSDAAPGWVFGNAVDLDGNTALIGSVALNRVGPQRTSGSAYVFTGSGAAWMEQAILAPSVRGSGDHYGYDVALDGDAAVVAAFGTNFSDGSVFVYERNGGTWIESQQLTGNGSTSRDFFGWAVDLLGNEIAVGAIFDDETTIPSGSVYRFHRTGPTWNQTQVLTSPEAGSLDRMGFSVALTSDWIAAGSPGDNGVSFPPGAAYVYSLLAAASVTGRSVTPNPDSYVADAPVIGEQWSGTVDLTTTGHAMAQVFGMSQPTSMSLGSGQVILITGNTLFTLSVMAGPIANYVRTIPNELAIVGTPVYSQAIHIGGITPLALSNAQDFIIGL